MPPHLGIAAVYGDAWRIYRLLFRRSVLTAAIVFAGVTVVQVSSDLTGGQAAAILFGLVLFVLSIAAPPFVQGALIEIVRNIHEGRPAKPIGALYGRARARLWPLVGASVYYALGVLIGLFLLLVPGLLAASRWALMAPFVVLEDHGVYQARDKSAQIVRPLTGRVLWIVLILFLIGSPSLLVDLFLLKSAIARDVFGFLWSSLTAPFGAHVFTVVYYRVTDPERPVIDPDVLRWRSVWLGA